MMDRGRASKRFKTYSFLASCVCLLFALRGESLSAAETTLDDKDAGREIALEMDRRDQGFVDSQVVAEMELRNKNGQVSKRALELRILEVISADANDLSIAIFEQPRDVAGTAFLTHPRVLESDDQWIYLPALKRTKRISSKNQSGPFMGSEFAYEDMSAPHVDRFTYSLLREEDLEGAPCWVVERRPLYENSGYTRQVMWVDQEEYRQLRIDYFDRKDELLKTLELRGYRQYDQYWRSHEQLMTNHRTGKSTLLSFHPFEFKRGLKEGDFQPAVLARSR